MKNPRTHKDLCQLCRKNKACDTESHIFPRFFTQSMFGEKSNKQGGGFDTSKLVGIKRAMDAGETVDVSDAFDGAVKDTAKERYILCHNCEHKRLGSMETYICAYFYNHYRKPYFAAEYPVLKRRIMCPGALDQMICRGVDSGMFKLFVYSMVWRASICSLPGFCNFRLDKKTEEDLRHVLDTCLHEKAPETKLFFKDNSHLFKQFQFTIFTPLDMKLATHNLVSNPEVNYDRGEYYFFINEFIIKFYSQWNDPTGTNQVFNNKALNSDSAPITLVILNEIQWINFIMTFVHKVVRNILSPY